MATVDPPWGLLTPPSIKQIWSAVTVDRAVAITAIICGTAAFCFLVWSLSQAKDANGIAMAVVMVLTAVAAIWSNRRGKSKT
jgi:hypothetical protein